jgi:hypothetical protein
MSKKKLARTLIEKCYFWAVEKNKKWSELSEITRALIEKKQNFVGGEDPPWCAQYWCEVRALPIRRCRRAAWQT